MFKSSQSWNAGPDDDIVSALKLALADIHCGVTIQNKDLNYLHIFNMPTVWPLNEDSVPTETGLYGASLGEKLTLAKLALAATGETQKMSALVDGKIATFSISAISATDGTKRIVTTIQDITQVRKRESTLRTLLLELSHRSKNLLAIVQSLASQSAKYATSKDDFLKAFNGRLHAVSGAQDVIVEANWQGASLYELARRQLASAVADSDVSVSFQGRDLELDPNQSLHLGLALHELAMLAAASGSEKLQTVSLSTEVGGKGDSVATITWQAKQRLEDQSIDGTFGKVLLERVVPAAVSGNAVLMFDHDGLDWTVSFPIANKPANKKRKWRRSGN